MSTPKYISDNEYYLTDDGNLVHIEHDDWCSSPREWDNLGTFYTWMRGYNSPDDGRPDSIESLAYEYGLEDVNDSPAKFVGKFNACRGVALLVYAYDHSGVCYKASDANPFCDPWDSGIAGVIFATNEKIKKYRMIDEVTQDVRDAVRECLVGEVDEYNEWANGNCHMFTTYDKFGEAIDDCCGFIGNDVEGIAWNCGGLNECEFDSLDEFMDAHTNDLDVLERDLDGIDAMIERLRDQRVEVARKIAEHNMNNAA